MSVHMNKQIILDRLLRLGLSETESEIYLHLLEKGAKTPLQLSREVGINRTKIYRLLDLLLQKKLIEESLSERGKKFKASSPSNLELIINIEEEILKSKKDIIQDTIDLLSQLPLQTHLGFEVIHHKGISGLEQMMWNELKAQEICLFANYNVDALVEKNFADLHRKEVSERNIKYKEIGNQPVTNDSSVTTYNKVSAPKKLYEYRRLPESVLKIRHGGIAIYNDTLAIYNWLDKEYVGIEIINRPLAQTNRQIFWHFWKIGK